MRTEGIGPAGNLLMGIQSNVPIYCVIVKEFSFRPLLLIVGSVFFVFCFFLSSGKLYHKLLLEESSNAPSKKLPHIAALSPFWEGLLFGSYFESPNAHQSSFVGPPNGHQSSFLGSPNGHQSFFLDLSNGHQSLLFEPSNGHQSSF